MAETKTESFPPQIKYIVGNEVCERFSYYGMRGILVVYLAKYLHMSDIDAKVIFHIFAGTGYLSTLLGGYLADRLLGKYRTIIYLSLVYCLGHAVLALFDTRTGVYAGLLLIALGMGGVKSCVSAYVGDQFNEGNKHLVEKIFDVFYWSINFGAFFSAILIPIVLAKWGPGWAFGIPGILMGVATLIFWLGRKQYVQVPPSSQTGDAGFMPIFFCALKNQGQRKPGQGFFDAALVKYPAKDVEAAAAAARVFKVFAFVSVLWALFDQQSSSWVLQADQMNLKVWGFQLYASQIHAINPIMIMVLIPVFALYIYPGIEKMGIKLTPLRKMTAGMFTAAVGFVAVGMIQVSIDAGHHPSVAWQFFPYLIMAISEVMISITGLDFAYSQAPRSMKSTIMSFWFLTTFFGNSLTAWISKINVFHGATYFFFFAGIMTLASFAFAWIAYNYKVQDYYEKAAA